jgi:hypothetical protein
MKRILTLILIVSLGLYSFAASPIEPLGGAAFSVSMGASSVFVDFGKLKMGLSDSQAKEFLRFLEVSLELLQKINSDNLLDGNSYDFKTFSAGTISIRATLIAKQLESDKGYFSWYVYTSGSYQLLRISSNNLKELISQVTENLKAAEDLKSKSGAIKKLILNAQLSF